MYPMLFVLICYVICYIAMEAMADQHSLRVISWDSTAGVRISHEQRSDERLGELMCFFDRGLLTINIH